MFGWLSLATLVVVTAFGRFRNMMVVTAALLLTAMPLGHVAVIRAMAFSSALAVGSMLRSWRVEDEHSLETMVTRDTRVSSNPMRSVD